MFETETWRGQSEIVEVLEESVEEAIEAPPEEVEDVVDVGHSVGL